MLLFVQLGHSCTFSMAADTVENTGVKYKILVKRKTNDDDSPVLYVQAQNVCVV